MPFRENQVAKVLLDHLVLQELKVHLAHEVLKVKEDLQDHQVFLEQKGQKAKLVQMVDLEELVHLDLLDPQVTEELQGCQALRDLLAVEELKVPKGSVVIQERQEKKGQTVLLA